ncbi:MAG: hypothetical protein FWG61_03865 [Firmicutes bacterium]|nr:hypothetical protein [Bacillota bacterium]
MNFTEKRLPIIISIVISIALIAVWSYILIHNTPPSPSEPTPLPVAEEIPFELTILAEKESFAGLETDSGFIISSPAPLNAVELAARLSLMPETPFKLEQRTETELFLQPQETLKPGSVYNILLSENSYEPPISWAFQTKTVFQLQKHHPADGRLWVSVKSGIELTFTQPVGDITPYVTISPDLLGHWEKLTDNTFVFIPSVQMSYYSDYTVTLAADLLSLDGARLDEEISFTFRTENNLAAQEYSLYPYNGFSGTFTTSDPIFVELYADDIFADYDLKVNIYRFNTIEAYLEAEKIGKCDISLFKDDIEKISDFSAQLIMSNEIYWNLAYLPLPENPGPGWYLIDIQVVSDNYLTNQHTQKLLQITDIAVYAQTANNQLLLWLNDTISGQPLAAAQVTLEEQTALSNEQGIVWFDVEPEKQEEINYNWEYYSQKKQVRIQREDMEYGANLSIFGKPHLFWRDIYYIYVYTDRQAYLPNDTVHFWGMVLPRADSAKRPESIKLAWNTDDLSPEGIDIAVEANGAFMGEIVFEKQSFGWKELSFSLDDIILTTTNFIVMDYVKPVYTASLSLDKPYYRKGESINVLSELSFFDGTPAGGIDVDFSYWGYSDVTFSDSRSTKSDSNGNCNATFDVKSGQSWYPYYNYISFSTQGAEDQSIYYQQSAMVFPSKYMIVNSFTAAEDGYTFNINGYSIDFTAVDNGEYWRRRNNDLLKGSAAELTGEAVLNKVEYIRTKTGEFYDFINKVTVDRYSYESQESVVMTIPLQTENGAFVSETIPYPEGDSIYYHMDVTVITPDGQTLRETCYTPGERYYYWDMKRDLYQRYSFRQTIYKGDDNDYSYSTWHRYLKNEQVNIDLIDQKNKSPESGNMLYTVVGQKLHSYDVLQEMNFDLKFLAEYSPNVLVMGAYFDGRHIFSVEPITLAYKYDESELTMEITADKERYLPGEEVSLQLHITDSAGQGQAAHYLLSVADEAAFAVMDQEVEPLSSIYSTFDIYYNQYVSYKQPYDFDVGAESGEGGGENTRRDFVDTLAFISGQADEQGFSTVKFNMADNLTSWRLTAIAFCEKNYGTVNLPLVGKSITNIPCSLPFFINQVLNGRYLAKESIGLSLRAAGSAITGSDIVSYEIHLFGQNADSTQMAQAAAGDFLPIVFDPLPAGEYIIVIKATCGSYSDALELPVTVVESLLTTHRRQSGELKNSLNITARRFPVRLTLYDLDNQLFYDSLYTLLSAGGQRADQSLVRALAGTQLNKLEGGDYYSTSLDIANEEINSWRYGLRLFPYAQTDPLLTAKAVAVAEQFLDIPALTSYFRNILETDSSYIEDTCAAYMGLAALKEPVLLELRELFALTQKDKGIPLVDNLHLATALALIGDHNTAREWYDANIHPALESWGNNLYYSSANDAHTNYVISAECTMLAILLNHADHRDLLNYLLNQRSTTYSPLLEIASYINKYDPNPESAAACTYIQGEKTIDISFANKRQLYLELGEEQMAQAEFMVTKGHVGYNAYYFGGLAEAEKQLPEGVEISRTFSTDKLKLGETLTITTTITFASNAAVGTYHIAQVVPTGLRFMSVPDYDYHNKWYYNIGEMGLIDFYILPESKKSNSDAFGRVSMPSSVTISYKACAVLPGTYIMEADAISFFGNNTLYADERQQVSIANE